MKWVLFSCLFLVIGACCTGNNELLMPRSLQSKDGGAGASSRHIFVRVGTFITGSTDQWVIDAIRKSIKNYNALPNRNCTFRTTFFLGNNIAKSRFKKEELEPAAYNYNVSGDILQMNFKENMNSGKSILWFETALRRYHKADYFVKRDTDTVVNHEKLCETLSTLDPSRNIYFGRMNDYEWCGKRRHCPPVGCADFKDPKCWIYMSGGFYGISKPLATAMVKYPQLMYFRKGIEDLQTGKLIRAAIADGNVDVVNWENGLYWCHFKRRTEISPAILSGDESFENYECTKRRRLMRV